MKASKLAALPLAMAIGVFATISVAGAETTVESTTTKTTTYQGTVSEINPSTSTMILKSETAASPVTYSFTPQTVFVDETGATVSVDAIRTKPVRVEYADEGGKTIVRKVTVIKNP